MATCTTVKSNKTRNTGRESMFGLMELFMLDSSKTMEAKEKALSSTLITLSTGGSGKTTRDTERAS